MKDKLAELIHLENLLKEKMSESERKRMMGRIVARMICSLTKHLIKNAGYSVATTIIERELKEIGKSDANELMRIFQFKKGDPENASKILKIASMILGLKLDVIGDETIIRECPQGSEAVKLKESLMCNVCKEYCNGIVEEILGDDFFLERTKSLVNGDEYCMFKIRKK
jgi:predicted hydrocarbon binding protein